MSKSRLTVFAVVAIICIPLNLIMFREAYGVDIRCIVLSLSTAAATGLLCAGLFGSAPEEQYAHDAPLVDHAADRKQLSA